MPHSFLVVAFLALAMLPARAQPADEAASAWANGSHSQMRVIAGGRTQDGGYRIGVEIRLRDGFKTYWRVPGDAGVPPTFDWSASSNVGSVSLRWPAPTRFVDAGITTIGYKERVIFPAIVRPAEAGKPVTISLNLDYAVCDRICIPAKGQATLRLPDAAETAQTKDVVAFRDRAPRVIEAGKSGAWLALVRAAVVQPQGKKQVEIAVEVPQGGRFEDAFLEGRMAGCSGRRSSSAARATSASTGFPSTRSRRTWSGWFRSR